jgi:tetratricopeptide (TPR) repeat protein
MLRCLVGALAFFAACGVALSQGESSARLAFGDISIFLEQVPSGPAKLAELQAKFRAKPPRGANGFSLARFHYERAQAAGELGDSRGEIEGLRKAAALVKRTAGEEEAQYLQELASALARGGNFFDALAICERAFPIANPGRLVMLGSAAAGYYAAIGDSDRAHAALALAEDGYERVRRLRSPIARSMSGFFMGVIHFGRGVVLVVDGGAREAETALRRSVQELGEERPRASARASSGQIPSSQSPESHGRMVDDWQDAAELRLADLLTGLERLDEAEAVLRGVLARLSARFGPRHFATTQSFGSYSRLLYLQARFHEAEELARAAVRSYEKARVLPEAAPLARARREWARSLAAQQRWDEALAVFEAMRAGVAVDSRSIESFGAGDIDWATALIATGKPGEAAAMLRSLIARSGDPSESGNLQRGMLRGMLGIALSRTGKRSEALRELEAALPAFAGEESGIGERPRVRERRIARIVDAYIKLQTGARGRNAGESAGALKAGGGALQLASSVGPASPTISRSALKSSR